MTNNIQMQHPPRQTECLECKTVLALRVLKSRAGYYVGYRCDDCGPHGRISGYFRTEAEAEAALNG
jgi:RNase P subunit RPR2